MSTQRGNSTRTRPQKYKNKSAFKNNLHDKTDRTKQINNLQISDVCVRCKQVIEWKIKYKKYKPLTQPKKCVKCEQRNVKHAYHVMCLDCGRKLGLCTKCCEKKELVVPHPSQLVIHPHERIEILLANLPERKRRAMIRFMNKKKENQDQEAVMAKLESLKLKDDKDEDDNDTDNSDFDDFDLE